MYEFNNVHRLREIENIIGFKPDYIVLSCNPEVLEGLTRIKKHTYGTLLFRGSFYTGVNFNKELCLIADFEEMRRLIGVRCYNKNFIDLIY